MSPRRIVIVGLTITSSWGNGHATTYRGLVRELEKRGHEVLFLEHDKPYYRQNRDMPSPPFGRTELYASVDDLKRRFRSEVRRADLVILGSYVPEGVAVGEWLLETAQGAVAFYDIDTPVTFAKLARHDHEYLHPDLIPRFDGYLSFTGGPMLDHIQERWGARRAWPLYCSVDPELYHPEERERKWDMGYLGTYSDDRQPTLDALLVEPARRWAEGRFVVAGPKYPESIAWPGNVARIEHLPPAEHRGFYNAQAVTLNVTRADMVKWGWSPSVRLFEAAACGTPIVSDWWEGLDTLLRPDEEIFIARSAEDALAVVRDMPDAEREAVGRRARERVLAQHTAAHRARELEEHAKAMLNEVTRRA